MNTALLRALAALFSLALVAAACGSEDATSTAAADDGTSTTEAMSDDAMSDDGMSDDDMAMDEDAMSDDMAMDTDGHHDSDDGHHGDDDGHHHHHDELDPIETDLDLGLTLVSAEVDGDSVTVTIEPSGDFTFVDDETGTANGHVDGEGHVHLYIDGEKITRMYETTYTHTGLAPGEHSVRVELSTNAHNPYAIDGIVIDDLLQIDVEGEVDEVVELTIAEGVAEGGVQEYEVPLGSTVSIRVTSDATHEVHVHGYDLYVDAMPGMVMTLNMTADIPGQFEIEIEETGQLIAELVVS